LKNKSNGGMQMGKVIERIELKNGKTAEVIFNNNGKYGHWYNLIVKDKSDKTIFTKESQSREEIDHYLQKFVKEF
jgi:hypothetical protein